MSGCGCASAMKIPPGSPEQLARFAGVHPRQVSYAGLKDRRAVTEQWFSVQMPGRDAPDWEAMNSDTLTVLRHARHSRKLRRGALRGNRFRIMLREIEGDLAELEQRLTRIDGQGVPNYFAEQRFGRDGSNLLDAQRLFAKPAPRFSRNRRSLALSAARSLLFNQVLSRRVKHGDLEYPDQTGMPCNSTAATVILLPRSIDAELLGRVHSQDVHPTGPLHGRGEIPVQGECRALEQAVLADYSGLVCRPGISRAETGAACAAADDAGAVLADGMARLTCSWNSVCRPVPTLPVCCVSWCWGRRSRAGPCNGRLAGKR